MKKYPIIPYGFGNRLCRLLPDTADVINYSHGEICLILKQRPTPRQLKRLKHNSAVAAFLLPELSPYSHFILNIWNTEKPAACYSDGIEILITSYQALILFDDNEILVAENKTEEKKLGILYTHLNELKSKKTNLLREPIFKVYYEPSNLAHANKILDQKKHLSILKIEEILSMIKKDEKSFGKFLKSLNDNTDAVVLLRFFDKAPSGGNKRISYLGKRGIRLLDPSQELLQPLKSAIVALNNPNITIVFPMVTMAEEFATLMFFLKEQGVNVGITVETPAAAIMIDSFLAFVSFVEIGLNDLTQYTMASNRDVPNKHRLPVDKIAKPVEILISSVVQACASKSVPYMIGLDLKPSKQLAAQLESLNITTISCPAVLAPYWEEYYR